MEKLSIATMTNLKRAKHRSERHRDRRINSHVTIGAALSYIIVRVRAMNKVNITSREADQSQVEQWTNPPRPKWEWIPNRNEIVVVQTDQINLKAAQGQCDSVTGIIFVWPRIRLLRTRGDFLDGVWCKPLVRPPSDFCSIKFHRNDHLLCNLPIFRYTSG